MPSGSRAIPAAKEGKYLKDPQTPWWRVRKATGLDDVRIHDLRHSYAPRALALGESLTMMRLLKNPVLERSERRTRWQCPLGGWFGWWGREGLPMEPFQRLGPSKGPTKRHEGRWQAA